MDDLFLLIRQEIPNILPGIGIILFRFLQRVKMAKKSITKARVVSSFRVLFLGSLSFQEGL